MTAIKDWILFTGSKEQIDEIKSAYNGVIFLDKHIDYDDWIFYSSEHDLSNIDATTLIAYYICDTHPYCQIIQQWSLTKQPVYIKCNIIGLENSETIKLTCGNFDGYFYYMSNNPNWNILGAEYSLKPFTNILKHRYENIREAILKGKNDDY